MTQTDGSTTTEAIQSGVAGESAETDGMAIFAGTDVPVAKLFECLEESHNLNIFLHLFPSVTREQALAAMEEHNRAEAASLIHSNPRHRERMARLQRDPLSHKEPLRLSRHGVQPRRLPPRFSYGQS